MPARKLEDTPVDLVTAAKEEFAGDLPKGVHQKLNLILRSLPDDMRPAGRNAHFKYDYWSLDQISGFFRNRFAELGLSFMADVKSFDIHEHSTGKGGVSLLTTALVLFTITDSDTGDTISGHGIGQGDDPGDKGANKAMSGALKYWLLKTFIVGGEDSEADDYTDRRNDPGRDERRDVKITESHIEGIQRGGRANKTTDAQIRQIRHLAADLTWTAIGTARRLAEWLDEEWELPEEPEEQGPALLRYLERLDADDAGLVITKMIDLRDTPDEDANDVASDDEPGSGYP